MLFVRIFKFLVAAAFCINLVFLLLALSSPYYNPKYVWLPAFFGLFFKVFLTVHLFFILVFLIARLKRLFIFSMIMILFCIPILVRTIALRAFKGADISSKHLTLMTYNVNSFTFFRDSVSIFQIVDDIKNEKPDIICFQEYLMHPAYHQAVLSKIKAAGYNYYYEYITELIKPHNSVGQAIFSKIPFYNVQPIPFKNTSNGAFSADFPYDNDTFRLFNVHFQSISLIDNEIKIPSSLQDFKSPQKDYYWMFFVKLRDAFRKRSYQALKVKEYAQNSPYKVIICGDFNDTPGSFLYRELTEKFDDTFLKTNFGLGSTFAGKIPLQRIDYVLMDPGIKPGITKVIHVGGSDHFPVVSTFAFH